MLIDKSLHYYGKTFHMLIDPLSKVARAKIIDLIPEDSNIFDAGCGTGTLSLLLKKKKNCKVIGADLSLRMIDFARKSNPYKDVCFLHMDISDLAEYKDKSFDYSIICLVIHELPSDKQLDVIKELMRVGRRTIILDSNTPLPMNFVGLFIRAIEATFGRDHYENFKTYISSGGIIGILERAGLLSNIIQRIVFRSKCQQIVVLSS